MNYKTIRAYQFKADEAVAALEAAGAVWTVGKGKPHWAMPIAPTVDVEAIKKEARKEFLAEIMAIDAPKPELVRTPLRSDLSRSLIAITKMRKAILYLEESQC